jgi:AcrR family transcriptional regulator
MNARASTLKTEARKRRPARKRASLEQADWIAEARNLLISGGIGAVKIGHLARKLRVTREAFYWHFKNLSELCDELILDWERRNSLAYRALLDPQERNGVEELRAIVAAWVNEERLSPSWDAALRDWARTSKMVARVVKRVDIMRIGVIEQIFRDMGMEDMEATVRARIMYFHQVGYYSIDMHESAENRRRLLPMYLRIITGKEIFG